MSDNLPSPIPLKVVGKLPVISAESYQHVGRYAGSAILAAFEMIGGVERLASWADTNPSDFFGKVFLKLPSRTAQVDVSGSITIDEAISRLEREAVDAEFTELPEQDDLAPEASDQGPDFPFGNKEELDYDI